MDWSTRSFGLKPAHIVIIRSPHAEGVKRWFKVNSKAHKLGFKSVVKLDILTYFLIVRKSSFSSRLCNPAWTLHPCLTPLNNKNVSDQFLINRIRKSVQNTTRKLACQFFIIGTLDLQAVTTLK